MADDGRLLACVLPEFFAPLIIRPALEIIELWTPAAEQLLLGTAIHESKGFRYRKQINGPALGLFQMEPSTHNDIWSNYLHYQKKLADEVTTLLTDPKADKLEELRINDQYAAAMARIQYKRLSKDAPLPKLNDIQGMAQYWKKYYNTVKGKGTVKQFIDDWNSMAPKQ